MNDLTNKLKDSKFMRIVTAETDAIVLLEVLDRENRRETNMWGRQNKSYLAAGVNIASLPRCGIVRDITSRPCWV